MYSIRYPISEYSFKLEHYGVRGNLKWFGDFLSEVVIDGTKSPPLPVPLRHSTRPTAILAHINDMPEGMRSTVKLTDDSLGKSATRGTAKNSNEISIDCKSGK